MMDTDSHSSFQHNKRRATKPGREVERQAAEQLKEAQKSIALLSKFLGTSSRRRIPSTLSAPNTSRTAFTPHEAAVLSVAKSWDEFIERARPSIRNSVARFDEKLRLRGVTVAEKSTVTRDDSSLLRTRVRVNVGLQPYKCVEFNNRSTTLRTLRKLYDPNGEGRRREPSFYTDAALLRRDGLRRDKRVTALLNELWEVIDANGDHVIDHSEYECFHRKLVLVLAPEKAMFPEQRRAMCERDWRTDTQGGKFNHINGARFCASIFQLADQWTGEISAKAMCKFISHLIKELTKPATVNANARTKTRIGAIGRVFRTDEEIRRSVAAQQRRTKRRTRRASMTAWKNSTGGAVVAIKEAVAANAKAAKASHVFPSSSRAKRHTLDSLPPRCAGVAVVAIKEAVAANTKAAKPSHAFPSSSRAKRHTLDSLPPRCTGAATVAVGDHRRGQIALLSAPRVRRKTLQHLPIRSPPTKVPTTTTPFSLLSSVSSDRTLRQRTDSLWAQLPAAAHLPPLQRHSWTREFT